MNERDTLTSGARALGVDLSDSAADKLLQLLDELARWNKAYNLTSIEDRGGMLTAHVLDSLAPQADLVGPRIADLGTGGGFPGLPLALLNPQWRFTLVDTVGKKIRFVAHAARTLGLTNVEPTHARVETLEGPFDTIVARAFAPLPKLLELAKPLCAPRGQVVAMLGQAPATPELPPGWHQSSFRRVEIPGLGAERHVLTARLAA